MSDALTEHGPGAPLPRDRWGRRMNERPLSEKSPYSPLRIHTFDWDEVNGDTYVHESEIAALEAELAEAKRTLDENDKIYLHASEVIADRNRLRDAIRRVLPRLVQTHSVYKSLRAALEGGDG